jgi:hypothetical protein
MSQRTRRVPPHGRWKEYGSECYWAGLVGALLARRPRGLLGGRREHDRSASEVVRQAAR